MLCLRITRFTKEVRFREGVNIQHKYYITDTDVGIWWWWWFDFRAVVSSRNVTRTVLCRSPATELMGKHSKKIIPYGCTEEYTIVVSYPESANSVSHHKLPIMLGYTKRVRRAQHRLSAYIGSMYNVCLHPIGARVQSYRTADPQPEFILPH